MICAWFRMWCSHKSSRCQTSRNTKVSAVLTVISLCTAGRWRRISTMMTWWSIASKIVCPELLLNGTWAWNVLRSVHRGTCPKLFWNNTSIILIWLRRGRNYRIRRRSLMRPLKNMLNSGVRWPPESDRLCQMTNWLISSRVHFMDCIIRRWLGVLLQTLQIW